MTMSSTEATTDRSTAAALSAQQPARLTLQQRDQILDALSHASAVQAHMRTVGDDPQERGSAVATCQAATVDSTRQELQQLLNGLTTTSVNTVLLDRTIERDSLLDELGTLKGVLAASDRVAQEQRAELQRLQDRLDHAADRAEAFRLFKQKVVAVADGYAQEHGWSVIDQTLEDLGLERAPKEYRAKLTITCAKCSEVLPYRDLDNGRGTAGIGDDAVITTKFELTSECLAASLALKTVGALATFLDAMADYETGLTAMGQAAAALPVLPAPWQLIQCCDEPDMLSCYDGEGSSAMVEFDDGDYTD